MASRAPFLHILILVMFLVGSIHAYAVDSMNNNRRRRSLQGLDNRRTNKLQQGRTVDCSKIGSKSDCLGYVNCRWCRSDALDHMCFSKIEAWRLPTQVFSCD